MTRPPSARRRVAALSAVAVLTLVGCGRDDGASVRELDGEGTGTGTGSVTGSGSATHTGSGSATDAGTEAGTETPAS